MCVVAAAMHGQAVHQVHIVRVKVLTRLSALMNRMRPALLGFSLIALAGAAAANAQTDKQQNQ